MKKIMLQGYLNVSNFGDVIFGHLFYEQCKMLGFDEVDFYQYKNLGIGEQCRYELQYYTKKRFFQCLKADAFVLISGGSLWDPGISNKEAKIRFLRYIFPARLYQLMGKPVYILGLGGGPVITPWLRRQMVKMLNKAKIIYFRDQSTKKVFEGYGVENEMVVTADTALIIKRDMWRPFEKKEELDRFSGQRKKILLHFPDNPIAIEKLANYVVQGLILFLKENPDHVVILCNDNIHNRGEREKNAIQLIKRLLANAHVDVYCYEYYDSWQTCSLIDEADCVITAKLHVGVIGCVLNKSVVSFPVHREKTQNFFAMINESRRCVHMDTIDARRAYEQICEFHDKPVYISQELIEQAKKNLQVLEEIRKQ